MSEPKSLTGIAVSRLAITILLTLACSASAFAQFAPAPRVGGSGTFDAAPNTGQTGNDAGGRRRLSPLSAVPENFSTLKLAPGFLLNMAIYDTPEYSAELRIDANGDVNVPMVGSVHIADLTLVQAANKIAASLRDSKMLTDPHINLNVEEYAGAQVTVLGEVHNPGRIELLAPQHLDDVLAMAGGLTEYAGRDINIRHATGSEPRDAVIQFTEKADDHTLNTTLVLPGDTVTVKRAGVVYVLGAVTRPGGYIMQENGELNVTQALALAYGTTLPAAVGSMRLIRKQEDGKMQEISIPYRDMVKGKVAPLRLQAEDVIYVPVSKVKTVLGAGLLNTGISAAIIYR